MKNKIINYTDLVKRNEQIDKLKQEGLIIIPKKRLSVLGWVFIGLGVLPIPFTTPLFIAIGLGLLGLSKPVLIARVKHKIFMIKYKRLWK